MKGFNIDMAKFWVTSKLMAFLQSNLPDYWIDSLDQFCSNKNLRVFSLLKGSKVWTDVAN
jgi:hypothetical protein